MAAAEEQPAVPGMTAGTARRRALALGIGLAALLALLWLGDVLSGIVPHNAYHPATQAAGALRIALIAPTQPQAGVPERLQVTVTNAAGQPLVGATVGYRWNMTTMDMGAASGSATPDVATLGAYDLTVTALMSGYWRLNVTVRAPGQPPATTAFDLPEHN